MLMFVMQYTQVMAYTFINARDDGYWVRPLYLSRSLSSDHIACVLEAVNIYNIQTTRAPIIISPIWRSSYIRVSYYSEDDVSIRSTGSTFYRGHLQSDNIWLIDSMDINISPDISLYNACVSIVLHEIVHTRGLYHSDVPGSIMNLSIAFKDGHMIDTEYPMLSPDDIDGISAVY